MPVGVDLDAWGVVDLHAIGVAKCAPLEGLLNFSLVAARNPPWVSSFDSRSDSMPDLDGVIAPQRVVLETSGRPS